MTGTFSLSVLFIKTISVLPPSVGLSMQTLPFTVYFYVTSFSCDPSSPRRCLMNRTGSQQARGSYLPPFKTLRCFSL